MITQYFDLNQRLIIQSPGTLAPATSTPWVYGDNYDLAIYLTAAGIIQPIGANDTLSLMLFQPAVNLPEANLAIVGLPVITTDPAGFQYYLININLATVPLATLVQTPNKSALCQFHYIFTPADGERFSSSADLAITVNPDPSQSATGATPVPPGYPTSPNVFELIAHKGAVSGYASLDATGKVPTAQLPASTAGGDMLKSVYDTNNNGIVDTCDTIVSSRVTGLGTAAVVNVPASGNATATQAVLGNDTRLTDTRTPISHQTTHNGGTDAIPLATTAAQGLCPPVDGTTVQVVGGKLTATTSGNGDMLKSVFVTGNPTNANAVDNTLAVQTHQVPATGNASGAQLVLATDTRLADARTPTNHEITHLPGGSDPIPLVTLAASGLCIPPDGTTIQITGGKLVGVSAGFNINARIHGAASPTSIGANSTVQVTCNQTTDYNNGGFTIGAASLTVPAGQAGLYIMGGMIPFNPASATNGGIAIVLNNTAIIAFSGGNIPVPFGTSVYYAELSVTTMYHLNAADFISLYGISGSISLPTVSGGSGLTAQAPTLWLARLV
jgi:hypothetical protein